MGNHGKQLRETAQAFVAAVGGEDINLVQQAYYNSNYRFCGAKVQHVLQADGLCYTPFLALYVGMMLLSFIAAL